MKETLWLVHDVRAPSRARHWIVRCCYEWNCAQLADSAALMITELVTNVFLHARTDCVIDAIYAAPTLRVTVTDEDAHLLLPQAQSSTAEEGRGLAIIATLADRWGVEQNDGRKSVWFDLSG
jgi:anti-sigma regulatory factor (Ser/Thr protein kinase)